MLTLHPSDKRGVTQIDWLDSKHSFSFGNFYDPKRMGFRGLRVINEDIVAPGAGFPPHGHRDMEIITYMIEGALAHKDSLGHGEALHPGEVQVMSAGKGIEHSEFNASKTDPAHLLQIWIKPQNLYLPPAYAQKKIPANGALTLAVAPKGAPLSLNADAKIFTGKLKEGEKTVYDIAKGRGLWVQLARGEMKIDDVILKAGDGLAVEDEIAITLTASKDAEFLLFDLA
ncbi:MAG: pirin family protein [Dongiaceae bacterium]